MVGSARKTFLNSPFRFGSASRKRRRASCISHEPGNNAAKCENKTKKVFLSKFGPDGGHLRAFIPQAQRAHYVGHFGTE